MKSILVVGSSNTDMVIRIPELPKPGQTISGGEFQIFGGGKGANQAIAARRAGAKVTFIAAVGNDDFGKTAIASIRAEGIETTGIEVDYEAPSHSPHDSGNVASAGWSDIRSVTQEAVSIHRCLQ